LRIVNGFHFFHGCKERESMWNLEYISREVSKVESQ
jgi:hypothetical protein